MTLVRRFITALGDAFANLCEALYDRMAGYALDEERHHVPPALDEEWRRLAPEPESKPAPPAPVPADIQSILLNALKRRLARLWRVNGRDGSLCPMCGGDRWEVSPEVHQVPEFAAWPTLVTPAVCMSCSACHYIALFSAMALGVINAEGQVVESPPEPEEPPKEEHPMPQKKRPAPKRPKARTRKGPRKVPKRTAKKYRSAVSGEYVSARKAKRSPRTTVGESK